MVLFAVAFVVLCSIAALVLDLGSVYIKESNIQNAADVAAMAGAQDLPDANSASNTAIYYAGKNGCTAGTTVTSPYSGDPNKIEVVCTKTISYTFARVMGFSDTVIHARAVAKKENLGAAFDYTLFSGDSCAPLNINGSGLFIGGNAHSNYRCRINGSGQTITGSAEAVSTFKINGSNIKISNICMGSSVTTSGNNITIGTKIICPAPFIDMPDFSDIIQTQAETAGQVYMGNKTFNGSGISVDSPIFVDGDVTINGSSFTGSGCILATGDITFNGSGLNASGGAVCFYSETGNITLNGSDATIDGILYAPNGRISFNGSNSTVNGRVIGNKIAINGSSFRAVSGADDLDCLPASSVKLIE